MIQYLDNIQHKDSKNFFLIAGPCIIEGEDMALRIAEKVINITDKYNIPYIFKGALILFLNHLAINQNLRFYY